MFKIYWIIILVVGIFLPALGQAQQEAQQEQGKTGQQERPADYTPPPFRIEFVENETQAKAREAREAEADRREEQNLVAQEELNSVTQEMNAATQRMANYAYWQTWFVGLGTVLLIGTLTLTAQANIAALAVANATLNEQRPWLAFEFLGDPTISHGTRTSFSDFGKPTVSVGHISDPASIIAKLQVLNLGSLPAKDVWYGIMRVKAEWHQLGAPDPIKANLLDYFDGVIEGHRKASFVSYLLPNKGAAVSFTVPLDDDHLSDGPGHRLMPFVVAYVSYEAPGIKGRRHTGMVFSFHSDARLEFTYTGESYHGLALETAVRDQNTMIS